MRKAISLYIILSLVFIPAQHLLAGQIPTKCNDAIISSMESHQASHITLHSQNNEIEKSSVDSCNNSTACSFCTGVVQANIQVDSFQHSDRYVVSNVVFHSTSYFPELRPPRNT